LADRPALPASTSIWNQLHDGLHAHGVVQIRQTDFGIKPYTLLALRSTPNRRTTMSTRIGGDRAFT